MSATAGRAIDLKISQFEGPLDLLCHLIERNRIDIYDIPIAEITDQYLAYLKSLDDIDMESASEFLVMAATLLQIKSRMLLPHKAGSEGEPEPDPREELVLRLLEYRRCKTLAESLKKQHSTWQTSQGRLPEPPGRLGLSLEVPEERLSWDAFCQACQRLARQNQIRFNDLSGRISHILRREKLSLKEKMRQIWRAVAHRTSVYFSELFPFDEASRAERVTGFLALLELLRLNRVRAYQKRPFDLILLESDPHNPIDDDEQLNHFLSSAPVEEKDYE